jgi:mitogen-activated protein kinase 1/3
VTSIEDLFVGPPNAKDFKDLYIITELFECDLDRIVTSTQKLTDAHHQYFIYQMLRGLLWIHSANVLHRDLKPANLLVKSNCDLAICDFGLARGVPAKGDMMLTDYVQTRWYRAPELLCDNQVYDKKVDVWSAGLIFGELLCRKPTLQGKDYFDQLSKIVALIGKPSDEDMKHLQFETARKAIRRMPSGGNQIARKFGRYTENPLAIDLLEKMLVFNPDKRFSVEDCLNHKYLAELHQEGDEPRCTKPFDYSFEDGYKEEMPKDLIQKHMRACVEEVRRQQAAASNSTNTTK